MATFFATGANFVVLGQTYLNSTTAFSGSPEPLPRQPVANTRTFTIYDMPAAPPAGVYNPVYEQFTGPFTYQEPYLPVFLTGGSITGYVQSYLGSTTLTATGVDLPITTPFAVTSTAMGGFLLSGADTVTGSPFGDLINGLGGADLIDGAAGNDSLDGGVGGDTVQGGGGNDFIRGLEDDDSIDGGAGDDDVNGNTGVDYVTGADGADYVRGGQGADSVYGGQGDDMHVNGNIGDDIVHGDDGNDTVYGGQGADQVFGDAGNDLLSGDLGDDLLTGGAGGDWVRFAKGGGRDWVADFNLAEGDRIVLSPGQAYTLGEVAGQAVVDLGDGDAIGLVGVSLAQAGTFVIFA
jgi:Ca2+-binding RTX toxin-like protein